MIKRTLYFSNPCFLRKKDLQLLIEYTADDKRDSVSIPIEDAGIVILDNPYITVTNALLMALVENNTAIISCNTSHMPYALMLPMFSHHAFTERLRVQLNASQPLMKNLWQQTVIAKINNQAALLKKIGEDTKKLDFLAREVRRGDTTNVEGRAAAFYWDNLFVNSVFLRHRFGEPPNNLLNYGYAVLRAIVARSLVSSGLFPSLGIHHRNKYNPYCLADDVMEPYRPFVDELVMEIIKGYTQPVELTPSVKKELLQIPVIDIEIEGRTSPLMVGIQRTTASLASCFEGTARKILFPELK